MLSLQNYEITMQSAVYMLKVEIGGKSGACPGSNPPCSPPFFDHDEGFQILE